MATLVKHRKIVTDGLVFAVDAANVRSYSGSGTSTNSVVDFADTGTLINGVSFTDSSFGFDGVDDYIDLDSNVGVVTPISTGTVDMWFKAVDNGLASWALFSVTESVGATNQTRFEGGFSGSGGSLRIRVETGGVTHLIMKIDKGETFYEDGLWHHVVLVVDGVDNRMYVDGVKETVVFDAGSSTTATFLDVPSANTFSLGVTDYTPSLRHFLEGGIAMFSVYNVGLTDDQALQNYNANKLRFT